MSLVLIFNLSIKCVPRTLHNQIALYSCLSCFYIISKPNLGASISYKHDSNLRTFQSKWLLINPTIVTFLADSVPFKEKCISPNIQTQMPRNLVEMSLTKSYISCKNLSFIWLLDCYQISIIPPLLYAKNCCTIADKIHSKTEASLIQFSWNFYSILYHKSRACTSIFIPIQIDLITQTQTWSQLAQFFNFGQISTNWATLLQIESNLKLTCLNTFIRHKSIQYTC